VQIYKWHLEILLRLRNAKVTQDDWEHLMTRTSSNISNLQEFKNAIHLYPTIEAVAEHNLMKLKQNNQPITMIKAVHSGHNAAKDSSDDAGGLEPVLYLAHNARVMLISNLWVEAGLVNGAIGTVKAICYSSGEPAALPTAVMITFDSYSGPTLSDGTVPIVPLRRTWGHSCSRLQLPLKLAWAITIHKSQGLTLDKAVINIGKKEFSTGLTFVACSRLRQIKDLVFHPGFDYQRVANLSNSSRLTERRAEDIRLHSLFHWSNVCSTFNSI
jgi:ATP-dependent DNA helicase PIF1